MKLQSILDKEIELVSVVYECNTHIPKFTNKVDNSIYNLNFKNLAKNISPVFESEIPKSIITPKRENYFAYFKNVSTYLSKADSSIIKNLDESLFVDPKNFKSKKIKSFDIKTFKVELDSIIKELSSIDNIESYSVSVIKNLTFLKRPVYVYGFKLNNNLALNAELRSTFNITPILILFDKTYKRLFFIPEIMSQTVVYDIKMDNLEYFNSIYNPEYEEPFDDIKTDVANYVNIFGEKVNRNFVEIYLDSTKLDLKFTDNLFRDELRFEQYMKLHPTQYNNI